MKSLFGTLRRKVPAARLSTPPPSAFRDGHPIQDYASLDDLMRDVQVFAEDMNIVLAIDMTASNRTSGHLSFDGNCLHDNTHKPGPYLQVIDALQKTLNFDTDHTWPLYYFGSVEANQEGGALYVGTYHTLAELRQAYLSGASQQTLSGPTTFVPVIEETIVIATQTQRFHLLIIITDGVLADKDIGAHYQALTNAAKVPMAVCAIGVGDANFDIMEKFDDAVPGDADVFNFVPFNATMKAADKKGEDRGTALMFQALMEVPVQYESARRRLNYVPKFGPLAGKSSGPPPPYQAL